MEDPNNAILAPYHQLDRQAASGNPNNTQDKRPPLIEISFHGRAQEGALLSIFRSALA